MGERSAYSFDAFNPNFCSKSSIVVESRFVTVSSAALQGAHLSLRSSSLSFVWYLRDAGVSRHASTPSMDAASDAQPINMNSATATRPIQ